MKNELDKERFGLKKDVLKNTLAYILQNTLVVLITFSNWSLFHKISLNILTIKSSLSIVEKNLKNYLIISIFEIIVHNCGNINSNKPVLFQHVFNSNHIINVSFLHNLCYKTLRSLNFPFYQTLNLNINLYLLPK